MRTIFYVICFSIFLTGCNKTNDGIPNKALDQTPEKSEAESKQQEVHEADLEQFLSSLDMQYAGNKLYTSGYERTEEGADIKTFVQDEGYISVCAEDFDGDKQDEILLLTSGKTTDEFWWDSPTITMRMYEWDKETWKEQASHNTPFVMRQDSRYDIFYRELKDGMHIFGENYNVESYFANGEAWSLTDVVYKDGKFETNGEKLSFAGSGAPYVALKRMDPSIITEDEDSKRRVTEILDEIKRKEFDLDGIGLDLSMDRSEKDTVELAKFQAVRTISYDQIEQWKSQNQESELEGIRVHAVDYTHQGKIDEKVDYSCEVKTMEGADFTYPQFSDGHKASILPSINNVFLETAKSDSAKAGEPPEEDLDRIISRSFKQEYQKDNIISLSYVENTYTGGENPPIYKKGITLDLETGLELKPAEYLETEIDKIHSAVTEAFKQKINEEPDRFFQTAVDEIEKYVREGSIYYYFTGEALHAVIPMYMISMPTAGIVEVEVSVDTVQNQVSKEVPGKQEEQTVKSAGDYIIATSSKETVTQDVLGKLTKWELSLARNEIFARHGRIFVDNEIKTYFESKSWYEGSITPENFNDNVFSTVEKRNIELIQAEEAKR